MVALLIATPGFAMADTLGGLLGAIVGGAIGNEIGGGNGKKFATVVGVLAGASIGSRLEDGTYGITQSGSGYEYECVNCEGEYQQYQDNRHYSNPGAMAAAQRGAASRNAREQAAIEQAAYCREDPQAQECQYRRGSYGYGGQRDGVNVYVRSYADLLQ